MIHVQPALRSHNLAQLHVVEHPAEGDVPAHSVSFELLLRHWTTADYEVALVGICDHSR